MPAPAVGKSTFAPIVRCDAAYQSFLHEKTNNPAFPSGLPLEPALSPLLAANGFLAR
jgi:hypothetical protein